MKQLLFTVMLLTTLTATLQAQAQERAFTYTTRIGTAIALNEPACTPFLWQALAHYNLGQRFAIGAGTGVSIYEKTLIPLYGSVQFNLLKPRKLTPYIECNAGGAFATDKEVNGGFYLSPAIGMRIRLSQKLKLDLAIGYESQKLERVKEHTDTHFATEFKEKLNHHSITFKAGIAL